MLTVLGVLVCLAASAGPLAVVAVLLTFGMRSIETQRAPPHDVRADIASSGPTEWPAVLSVGSGANVALVYSSTWEHAVARCINTSTGVPLYVVTAAATTTTGGLGPFCDTCVGGAILPPLGRAWLRTSSGTASVSCGFSDGWADVSVPPSSGGGLGLGAADARFLKLDASNDPLTGPLTINNAGGVDATYSETGIDLSSASATTYNIQNSGAGAMTLQVDGTAVCTTAGGAGCSTNPGGADTNVQYNASGAFGGEAGLRWDRTNNRLGVNSTSYDAAPTSPTYGIHVKGSAADSWQHTVLAVEKVGLGSTDSGAESVLLALSGSGPSAALSARQAGAAWASYTYNGLLAQGNSVALEAQTGTGPLVISNRALDRIFIGANNGGARFGVIVDTANNVVVGSNGGTSTGAVTATAMLEVRGDDAALPALIVNETGSATGDTRIEGDTNAYLLFADASADAVGIGTSTPTAGTLTTALPIRWPAGTAAAPSAAFAADPTTGIYQGAGTGSVYVTSSGVRTASFGATNGHYLYAVDGTTVRFSSLTSGNFSGLDFAPTADGTLANGTNAARWSEVNVGPGSAAAVAVSVGVSDAGLYRNAAQDRVLLANGDGDVTVQALGTGSLGDLECRGQTSFALASTDGPVTINAGTSIGIWPTTGLNLGGTVIDLHPDTVTSLPAADCNADAEVGTLYRYSKNAGADIATCICAKVASTFTYNAIGAGDCT